MLMNNSSAQPVTSRIVTIPTHIAASSGTLIPERNLSHAKGNIDHQSQSQAHIVNAAIMQLNRQESTSSSDQQRIAQTKPNAASEIALKKQLTKRYGVILQGQQQNIKSHRSSLPSYEAQLFSKN